MMSTDPRPAEPRKRAEFGLFRGPGPHAVEDFHTGARIFVSHFSWRVVSVPTGRNRPDTTTADTAPQEERRPVPGCPR